MRGPAGTFLARISGAKRRKFSPSTRALSPVTRITALASHRPTIFLSIPPRVPTARAAPISPPSKAGGVSCNFFLPSMN